MPSISNVDSQSNCVLLVVHPSLTSSAEAGTAARAIVFATMSNTVVKGSIVLSSGSMALRKAGAPGMILMLIAGIGIALGTGK
jgi:uncharacterized membrane protein (DUF4010 family)